MNTFIPISRDELEEGIKAIDTISESLLLMAYNCNAGRMENYDSSDFLCDLPALALLRLRLRDAIDCIQRHEAKTA
jgi:hypothetical protein